MSMTPEERNELIARYAAGYEAATRSVAAFPRERLTERLMPGRWTACEIVITSATARCAPRCACVGCSRRSARGASTLGSRLLFFSRL
jgi:hypothetical protein